MPWATAEQLKDIRKMLKPAVEMAMQIHLDGSEGSHPHIGSLHFLSNSEFALCYDILYNQNITTSDVVETLPVVDEEGDAGGESDGIDGNTGLKNDCGMMEYQAAKTVIKASVVCRHTESTPTEKEKYILTKFLRPRFGEPQLDQRHNPSHDALLAPIALSQGLMSGAGPFGTERTGPMSSEQSAWIAENNTTGSSGHNKSSITFNQPMLTHGLPHFPAYALTKERVCRRPLMALLNTPLVSLSPSRLPPLPAAGNEEPEQQDKVQLQRITNTRDDALPSPPELSPQRRPADHEPGYDVDIHSQCTQQL